MLMKLGDASSSGFDNRHVQKAAQVFTDTKDVHFKALGTCLGTCLSRAVYNLQDLKDICSSDGRERRSSSEAEYPHLRKRQRYKRAQGVCTRG